MPGRPSARRERRQNWQAYGRAAAKYTAAAKSLIRLAESARGAASAWYGMDEPAIGGAAREAAAKMSAGSADRRDAAENLLKMCRLDRAGRTEMLPGVWRSEVAAGAVGMAALANMAAARWSASGALSSTPAAHVVLAEMSASDAWMDFAARVYAAERAAVGTALEARPAEERAAEAARNAERSVPTLPLEESEGGGGAAVGATGAMGSGASGGRAAEEGERAAEEVRRIAAGADARTAATWREAASVWAEASELWARVREEAAREGDMSAVALAAVQAKTTRENAARLGAA